jgi:anti-sigma factor RsiW
MAVESLRLSQEERANLVAYLDGELTEAESAALAAKLTQSMSARREVELLEATWELLEHLARPQVPADFTERTITLAAGAGVLDDRLANLASGSARIMAQWLLAAACLVVALGVGYSAARWAIPDRSSRLARNLTIAERLDDYRAAGSFEFLRQLDESTDFKEPSEVR